MQNKNKGGKIMSIENIKKFYEAVSKDETLKQLGVSYMVLPRYMMLPRTPCWQPL
jgi:hypothetical protein